MTEYNSQNHNTRKNSAQEFIEAMNQKGILFQGELLGDGQIHRFSTTVHKNKKDCWYVNYGMAGAFGDWSRGIHEVWTMKKSDTFSSNDEDLMQRQQREVRRVIEEDRLKRAVETASYASGKWEEFSETGSSPYLERKKVKPLGVRFMDQVIWIPLRDIQGKLWSLQYIDPNGNKRFLLEGRKKGCFHTLGSFEEGKTIYVVEGYATGASIHMALGDPVVVAFDAVNIHPVVEDLINAYPHNPIVIAGDDDQWKEQNMGRKYAEEASKKLGCSVVFPHFKNTSTKPTDFNDLHVLEGLEVIKEQLKGKDDPEWPEPTPLKLIKKDLSPVSDLELELIPEPYQVWLKDISERMQCPLDYVAIGSLIVSSSLIGAGCSIRPKSQDSWTVIPNLWGGIIGAPSTLKSPALKEILKPIETLEKEAFDTYTNDQKIFEVEGEFLKVKKEVLKKEMMKAAKTNDSMKQDMIKENYRNLEEPEKPLCKRFITNDATIEKMHELLSKNSRGLLLFRDELIGLLSSWDKDGNDSDRSFYLEAWNGYGSKTTDRIGRGTIHTKNLCVSILGSTQPNKLATYFQKTLSGADNDGLLQRFQLLVYPDEIMSWQLVDKIPNVEAQKQVTDIMVKLAKMNFADYGAILDESSGIPYFKFEPKAQELFYEWLTKLEERLRTSTDDPVLIEHFTKYRKLMPSLALIFHLINLAGGKARSSVNEDAVDRAILWCSYLEKHTRRIYDMSLNQAFQAGRALANRIQKSEVRGHFDVRDIYRKQWSSLKTKEDVELGCDLLMQKGWLREGVLQEGRKAKNCFFINPKTEGMESSLKRV